MRRTEQAVMIDHPARNLGNRTGNLVERNGPGDKLTQDRNDTRNVVELARVPCQNHVRKSGDFHYEIGTNLNVVRTETRVNSRSQGGGGILEEWRGYPDFDRQQESSDKFRQKSQCAKAVSTRV